MDLLERADDETAIADVIAATGYGTGAAMVVEAPAGLGKTSLLMRAASQATQAGVRVLHASCDMVEQDLPWSVVLQLFTDHPALAAELIEAPDATMLSNPLPILHRIHTMVADLAESGPLLLAIDDLHWADPQSLQCVQYLVRRIEHVPVAVLVAVRSGSHRDEVMATLDRICVIGPQAHRTLAPLSDGAIEVLARRCAPSAPEPTIRTIAQSVGGNPFLCREVAAQWDRLIEPRLGGRVGGDLQRLRSWMQMRLGETGPVAMRTAQAIAVLGRRATTPNVATVADIASSEVDECLDSLHRSGFLRVDHGIAFSHPILREVVYSATGPALRQELHHRCARLLADHGVVQEAATHLLASGPRRKDWELDALRAAAQADLVAAAPHRAVRFLRTALELTDADDRGQVLFELGRAELLAGDIEASGHLREALRTPTERPASVLQEIGDWLYSCALFTDAAHAYRLGLDHLAPTADRVQEARLIAGLHSADLFRGRYPDHTHAAVSVMATDPPSEPDAADRILLAIAAGESTVGLDRPRDTVLALARRAVAGDHVIELGRAVLEPLACAFMAYDEFGVAKRLLDDWIESAAERGEFVANTSLTALRSLCCFQMGELDQAELDATDVLALVGTHPAARTHLGAAVRALALTHLERSEIDAAERALDVDAEALWGDGWLLGVYLDARGRVDLARGCADAALEAFVGAGARFTAAGGAGGWVDWRSGAALAAHTVGDLKGARDWVEEGHKLAIGFGVPTRIASTLRTMARLEPDPVAQAGLLREAADHLQGSEATLDRARVLIDIGSAQRRMGRRRDCRNALRSGRELALRCGAWALAEHASDELEASGARRPTRAISGIDALTPAERRVAECAAAGKSNREIADVLFVTRKTVEAHLGSVYRKLEIAGRGDLVGDQWRTRLGESG